MVPSVTDGPGKSDAGSAAGQATPARRRGTLHGIGVGPGDPELLTLRGIRLLQAAAVVFAPGTRSAGTGYALSIVQSFIDPARQRIETLAFADSWDPAARVQAWSAAAERVAEVSAQGLDTVFITEGDPLTYSTFGQLAAALQRAHPEVPVEVTPGVTSFAAASAAVGQVLIEGDGRLAVIPATYGIDDLAELLRSFDTVVLMKVHTVFDRLVAELERLELSDHAVYVRRVGRPEQEVSCDLAALRGSVRDYLSLVIVRRVRGGEHG